MRLVLACLLLIISRVGMADDQLLYVDAGADAIANGQALIATAGAISDASASKPYLIELGPGSYNLSPNQLTLKPFVSLAGQGVGLTQLFLNSTSTQAALRLSGNQSVRDLHVQHLGSGTAATYTMAIQIAPSAKSVRLERLSVLAAGTGLSAGLYVAGDIRTQDVTVVAQNGSQAQALYVSGNGVVDIQNSSLAASNSGNGSATAIAGFSTSPVSWSLREVRVNAVHSTQTAYWLAANLTAPPVFRGLEVLGGKRGSAASCLASIGVDGSGQTNFIASGCPN